MSPRRLSGLQKQVLSFYRDVIRAARAKNPELKEQIEQYARLEMEKHRDIERKNVMLVEHYLRKGRKQLKLLQEGTIQVRREGNPSLSLSLVLVFAFGCCCCCWLLFNRSKKLSFSCFRESELLWNETRTEFGSF